MLQISLLNLCCLNLVYLQARIFPLANILPRESVLAVGFRRLLLHNLTADYRLYHHQQTQNI